MSLELIEAPVFSPAATETVKTLAGEATRTEFIRSALTSALWPLLSHARYDASRVEQLISLNADVNVVNDEGDYPLFKCCDDSNVIKMLLDAKADVNVRTHAGRTALTNSCAYSRVNHIKPLLDAKADANIECPGERSSYELAKLERRMQALDSRRHSRLDFAAGVAVSVQGHRWPGLLVPRAACCADPCGWRACAHQGATTACTCACPTAHTSASKSLSLEAVSPDE